MLQHEIDEARAVIDSVNVDRQTIEEYKELKNEIDKYHLEDPRKILNVLRALKKYKYDDKRIMAEFSVSPQFWALVTFIIHVYNHPKLYTHRTSPG